MFRLSPLIRWILLVLIFLLVTMSVARLFTYMIFAIPGQEDGSNWPVFWLGVRYDLRLVSVIGLVLLVLGSVKPLNPFQNKAAKKGWTWILGLVFLLLIIFYIIDFLHFRYLNQRLNASALSFLQDAGISATMVWQTYPVIQLLLAIIVLTWLMVLSLRRMFKWTEKPAQPIVSPFKWMYPLLLGILFAIGIFGRVGQYPLRWSDAFNLGSDFKANIALNPIQSFFSSFSFRSTSYDLAKVRASYNQMADWLGVTEKDSTALTFSRQVQPDSIANWAGTQTPNIVLVICESFSGYKSSMWGNPLNTTPYFAELCKNGLFFDNCFTPTIATARGVWATLTGIPDVELVKTSSRNPMMVDQHMIVNDFKDHSKYYFIGGSTSWANIRGILNNNIAGLKIFEEQDYDAPKIDVWGISDKHLFLQADKILRTEQHPFFAVIQTADNHRPYTIPEEDREALGVVNFPLDSLRKYGFESNEELNAFRYTDYCFKAFMEQAKTAPYFENTLFVFVGDHGIAGNAGPLFPESWTKNSLSSNHVPLLFYAPGKIPVKRVHDLASQVDVLPTIAGIANIPYRNSTMGRDLANMHFSGKGAESRAFILDINNKNRGIIYDQFYYSKSLQGNVQSLAWADFNKAQDKQEPPVDWYEWWSQAYFETARYLLLHNKKTITN
ncbi:sulfatase-like hydrolase/transferase [Flavihumibacter sp. RY-1]|uniref:Sulfatase-like hydrolase/transferase n=1 Tax=Flavihumibacter fluminis TaxID=2909236 RepID=A0ABS9BE79_9BACT|nr:sulfatase-like hydrolase/transferase [Flavihumibacter fluminis]MCF1713419.1 sulfatase-like hydrolase/transferase [Flavihumibacter fluminis]